MNPERGWPRIADSIASAGWDLNDQAFQEAVLRAVNLGDDADTMGGGAVCG